ncbi:hypothetical protein PI125_g9053 [Phytophthora idaei]|nr:hypothetical protein PI125_g9053 [Phytophthora idaei]
MDDDASAAQHSKTPVADRTTPNEASQRVVALGDTSGVKAGDGRRSNQSERPVRGAKDSDYDGVRSITKDGTITKHKAKVTMPEADQQTREDVRVRKSKQQRRPETIRASVRRVDETVALQLTDTVISEAQARNQLVQKMLEESVHKGMAVNTEYGIVTIQYGRVICAHHTLTHASLNYTTGQIENVKSDDG